ncbi:putative alpha/beta superfamily hydrolase [Winogradskyella pacifica]|uniref:Putative alpha/beta superfamily hydrolase n=1 Tax=Winogradskyella pacifica TaxID=664642 RepID=A0A3D9MZT4_9FLAO|nr:alpha/beta hydrolase-fold protein [Winogradskyella pacifica]REE24775.1 putative alpha/beta superfamily hydrolase [Winogradskyella pacifica]
MKLKYLYLLISAFIASEITAQNTASQQVTKFTIAAPQLNSVKTIWVYLPTNYKNSENSYPVIYMHDAQNLFDAETSFVGEWEVDEYMDTLTDNESIIIGIEHGNAKRTDELTPYTHKKHGGGQGDAYLSFIKNTLKPHIDKTYRTRSDAEHTTIFGSSLGGLLSFYAEIKYPETFGKAGVLSPAFWINPEIYDFVKASEIPETSKFYFLAGTDEGDTMIPKLEEMIKLLQSKGVYESQFESHHIKGGQHNEKLWATHFEQAYQWLY